MKVHPKQFVAVIKHIGQFWGQGCQCHVCKAVDKQENITKPGSRG